MSKKRWPGTGSSPKTALKNRHFRVRFGGGGGGHSKAYAVYAFINVDNCERPLITMGFSKDVPESMMFADDIVLCGGKEVDMMKCMDRGRKSLEDRDEGY